MELRIKDLIIAKISGEWGEDAAFGEGVKIIRTANFTNLGTIDLNDIVYRNIDPIKVDQKKLLAGDIIIEKSGGSPNQPVGRVVFFDLDTDEEYLCNNFTTILRPDITKIHPKYLFYQLFIGHIRGKTLKYQNNTTGIINLELDNYLNEKINIPTLQEQTRIVSVLSKCESLISRCKESITKSEEFLQSVFLEIFGDPVKAENKWKMEVLGTYITEIKAGTSYSGEEKEKLNDEELGVLKISAVTKGTFDPKEFKAVNKSIINKRVISPQKGDLLFSRANTRELVGATCIVDKDYPNLFLPDKLWKIELNETILDKQYLHFLLQNKNFKSNLTKDATGSSGSMLNISMQKLQKLLCPIPPINIQIHFSEIVDKTENIKDQCKAGLIELENLYGSLSQSVFNGNIDLSNLDVEIDQKYLQAMAIGGDQKQDDDHNQTELQKRRNKPKKEVKGKSNNKMTWGKVSSQQIAEWIKEKYQGYYFSSEMLIRFLIDEYVTFPDYYSSEELKKYPQLNSADDIKSFIFSAVNNENPFIKLEQHFYNAEKETFSLEITDEDYELLKTREAKERSGIYFRIIE